MRYIIGSYEGYPNPKNTIFLSPSTWDDYGFKTIFYATYVDSNANPTDLGNIKIAKHNQSSWTKDEISADYGKVFEKLSDEYYSLWLSADTYHVIYTLNQDNGFSIFSDLNDIAYDLNIYREYFGESAFINSLLRDTSPHTIQKQFHRISKGEAILTPYSFEYKIYNSNNINLSFEVKPESFPPTNIHAIIGSNGSGKTTITKNMIKSICKNADNAYGEFKYNDIIIDESDSIGYFESIICIAFSPFDDYSEITELDNCTFIGVNKNNIENLLTDIKSEFVESYKKCIGNKSKQIDLLDALKDIEIVSQNSWIFRYMTDSSEYAFEDIESELKKEFDILSSGQKVVLSIITRAIASLAEKTILFLDEPENHLHPPLLSSLIRCLSKMVIKRNSVAIISTHSPIVLQEIPKSNVWQIGRINDLLFAERPKIETFGENIGVLTNHIFGYELKSMGFNKILKEVVANSDTYEEALERFDYQLGNEAKSIVRVLLSRKEHQND